MAFKKKQISAENALMRLETLCACSEHCSYELTEKLRGWNVPFSEWDSILDKLARARYYDDARFAAAFVRDKLLYNRWGRRRIMLGLRAKRISSDIISDALAEIDEEEYEEVLRATVASKARSIKEGNTFEGRGKRFRSIVSRGFEPDLVGRIIRDDEIWGE